MRAIWSDRQIPLITCLKKLNVSGAFLTIVSYFGPEARKPPSLTAGQGAIVARGRKSRLSAAQPGL